MRKLINLTRASIGHFLAGSPTADQETIGRRLAICHGCDRYDPDPHDPSVGACRICGCGIRSRQRKWLSKLAWADQWCPHPEGARW